MRVASAFASFLLSATAAGACSSPPSPQAPSVPTAQTCEVGATKIAADGCNDCTCEDGNWSCTERGCVASNLPVHSSADSGVTPLQKAGDGCTLRLSVEIHRTPKGYMLAGYAQNLTDQPIEVNWGNRCVEGGGRFGGLPDHYNAFSDCARGMCPLDLDHITLLNPGARVSTSGAALEVAGNQCNEPLPPGLYTIFFSASTKTEGVTLCRSPAVQLQHTPSTDSNGR